MRFVFNTNYFFKKEKAPIIRYQSFIVALNIKKYNPIIYYLTLFCDYRKTIQAKSKNQQCITMQKCLQFGHKWSLHL